jgi:chaperonin cofactor prefoldin
MRNAKGKAVLVNAYSLLQDHFYEHMREAGFRDFERGERGSTAEHLTVLEYKSQQEAERAAAMTAVVEQKQEAAAALDTAIEDKAHTAAELDEQAEKQKKRLDGLEKKTAVAKGEAATFVEVDAIGKPALLGGYSVTADELKKLKTLAKEGVKSRSIIKELKDRISSLLQKIAGLETELTRFRGLGITDSMKYYQAKQRAPRRLAEIVADIMRKPPEQTEQQRTTPQRKRGHGIEI